MFVIFFCSFFVTGVSRYRVSLRDPVFYALMCEIFLYHTSFDLIAWWLGISTFKHVLPLLKITSERFLHAADTVDTSDLKVSEGERHGDSHLWPG